MSFTTGLSGLSAAQNMLSVTGNNLANSNTAGFKQSRSEFADVYSSSVSGVSSTLPGSGAKVASAAQQFAQGNLEFTENSLDLAISGEGFFVMGDSVTDPSALSYSRDGAFHLDDNGFVVNNSGNALMVYRPNDSANVAAGFSTGIKQPVQVSTDQSNPKATTAVNISLNLSSTATVPTPISGVFSTLDPTSYNFTTSVNVFDSLGSSHAVTSYYVKNATANVWDVFVDVDNSGGNPLNPTPGTPMNSDGVTPLNPVTNQLEFDTQGNLMANPASIPPPLLPSATTSPVSVVFTPTNGAAPLAFAINLAGSNQFNGASSVNTQSQDGHAAGNLIGVSADKAGVLFARFSNGSQTVLGEVAMAKFQNPQGLTKLGDTRWAESTASGIAIFGEGGVGNFGRLNSGALEQSNVDMASELVKLIIAQQMFQANSQTISTENQVITSIINL